MLSGLFVNTPKNNSRPFAFKFVFKLFYMSTWYMVLIRAKTSLMTLISNLNSITYLKKTLFSSLKIKKFQFLFNSYLNFENLVMKI